MTMKIPASQSHSVTTQKAHQTELTRFSNRQLTSLNIPAPALLGAEKNTPLVIASKDFGPIEHFPLKYTSLSIKDTAMFARLAHATVKSPVLPNLQEAAVQVQGCSRTLAHHHNDIEPSPAHVKTCGQQVRHSEHTLSYIAANTGLLWWALLMQSISSLAAGVQGTMLKSACRAEEAQPQTDDDGIQKVAPRSKLPVMMDQRQDTTIQQLQ